MDIVCLGELLIDLFPAEIGRRLVEVSAFHPKPGGAPGKPFEITVERANGERRQISGKTNVTLFEGDCVIMKSSGGGGYGAPAEAAREQEKT